MDLRFGGGDGALLARFGGATPRAGAEKAAALMRDAGLEVSLVDDDDQIWEQQRSAQRSSDGLAVRVSTLPSRFGDLFAFCDRAGARMVARAGLGLAWVTLEDDRRRRPRMRWRSFAAAMDPAPCAVLDAPEPDRRSLAPARRRAARADGADQGALRPGRRVPARAGVSDTAFDTPERALDRPDRRVRALRLLPAHLPHLLAVGRGDGLAARAHRADEGGARGGRRAVGADGRALGQLPGLHGLRDRLPVGGEVRQAAGGHPQPGGAQLPALLARAAAQAGRVHRLPQPPAAAGAGARPADRPAAARACSVR